MAQPNRHNIAYLREQLPSLSIAESGDSLWANLWFGLDERGKRKRVATCKVDARIYELAETDYHAEVLNKLMDDFVELRSKGMKKIGDKPKPAAAPKTDKQADNLATKVAKKITGKKASKKKAASK